MGYISAGELEIYTRGGLSVTREFWLSGIHFKEFQVEVPLDWHAKDQTNQNSINLLVRELSDPTRVGEDLPLLIHLEGGPGGASPRPLSRSGWIDEALRNYRVILIDQRGTGGSRGLEAADIEDMSAAHGADYLSYFRADSIIQDLEFVRKMHYEGRKWAVLAQSYGGFLTLSYLSMYPQALTACYICGGLPGTPPKAEEVYRRTFARAQARSLELYRRFPGDEQLVTEIADRLSTEQVLLPDGDVLTVHRLQSLGQSLGMGTGVDRLHWLFESAFASNGRFTNRFLERVMVETSSAESPLFWTLQENIYADAGSGPTGWAADRELANHPEFDATARPLLFTTEMTFPWMFDEVRNLKGFAPAVHELARRTQWPALYDLDQLAANAVPIAAAIYFDDVYVDSGLQLDTLRRVGSSQAWVTNEFEHDGIMSGRVFTRLRELVQNTGGEKK